MKIANNAINSDVHKRRFALLLPAGYGERYRAEQSSASLAGCESPSGKG
jgi:hypothetical protein